jgi:hypothetical protein
MTPLSVRVRAVRRWLAPLVVNVPGSASYIMELDNIAHELQASERPGRIDPTPPSGLDPDEGDDQGMP